MPAEFAIRVQGLGKCYHVYDKPQDRLKQSLWRGRRQYYREFWALRDVSFEVRPGETMGIIGRNGSGKSTLLQMIAGTLTPTTGSVETNGRIAALLELGSGFNPEFSGRENVFMNGAILGLTESEIATRFDEIAAFADIGDFIEQPVKTYSSGMMVRLAFAVSVCVRPDILIVDEALAVGDMAFQFKCMHRLEQLTQSGTTLLFVSHDIGSVKAFCHHALYLSHGEIKAQGEASHIAESYRLDMREEQASGLGKNRAVTAKPALAKGMGIAFGTDQGSVRKASFANTGGQQSVFSTGDEVLVEIELEYDHTLLKPAVSLILCDYRMIELAGRYCSLTPAMEGAPRRKSTVRFAFPALLNNGNYFLTVRLEDRISDARILLIDKQNGAMAFSVSRPMDHHFIGVVDLPFQMVEVAAADAPQARDEAA